MHNHQVGSPVEGDDRGSQAEDWSTSTAVRWASQASLCAAEGQVRHVL